MTRRLALVLALAAAACGGTPRAVPPAPDSPNAALAQFLDAVRANNIQAMGGLWGSERGPAAGWMKPEPLSKQLTVIQIYLRHGSYRVVEGPLPVPGRADGRLYRVELTREQCVRVQPIELVRTRRGGWVVVDVHLEAAGRPVGPCAPGGAGSGE